MHDVAIGAALAALLLVVAAAVIDAVRWMIPDTVSIGLLVLLVVFGLATPGFVWWSHLAALVVMFAFGLLAFSRGWLGGGDVKLLTALAAWAGLGSLPILFVATSIAGGVLVLLVSARQRLAGRAAVTHVPYAVAIAVGTVWWLWATGGGPLALQAAGDQRPVARASAT